MARKNTAVAEVETFNEETSVNEDTGIATTSDLVYKSFSVDPTQLEVRIQRRLMEYGFAKRLQDSVSGLAKRLTAETDESGNLVYSADEVNQAVLSAQQDAFDDITSGAWGTPKAKTPAAPRAPKVATIDSVMHKVATEIVKAKIKGTEHAKTLKGEALQSVIANYIAKHDETVRAEATRRMDAQTDTAGLDDLLNF